MNKHYFRGGTLVHWLCMSVAPMLFFFFLHINNDKRKKKSSFLNAFVCCVVEFMCFLEHSNLHLRITMSVGLATADVIPMFFFWINKYRFI